MQPREAARPRESGARTIKSRHRRHVKSGTSVSLKEYARNITDDDKVKVQNWFFNKRANFANPPQGIGSTRKKKGVAVKK